MFLVVITSHIFLLMILWLHLFPFQFSWGCSYLCFLVTYDLQIILRILSKSWFLCGNLGRHKSLIVVGCSFRNCLLILPKCREMTPLEGSPYGLSAPFMAHGKSPKLGLNSTHMRPNYEHTGLTKGPRWYLHDSGLPQNYQINESIHHII